MESKIKYKCPNCMVYNYTSRCSICGKDLGVWR